MIEIGTAVFFILAISVLFVYRWSRAGYSSILFYIMPVLLMYIHNELTMYKYRLIVFHSMISFFFNVVKENEYMQRTKICHLARCLDTSLVLFESLLYLTTNEYILFVIPTLFFVYKYIKYYCEIHVIFLSVSVMKLLLTNKLLIFVVFPGFYCMYLNMYVKDLLWRKYIWHFSSSITLAYCLISI